MLLLLLLVRGHHWGLRGGRRCSARSLVVVQDVLAWAGMAAGPTGSTSSTCTSVSLTEELLKVHGGGGVLWVATLPAAPDSLKITTDEVVGATAFH